MRAGWEAPASCLLLLLMCTSAPAALSRRLSSIIYEKIIIPDDRTVSYLLVPGQVVKLFYLLQNDVSMLSLTVTPCSSPVSWDLEYRNSNQTGKVEVEEAEIMGSEAEGTREQRQRLVSPASSGLYSVRLSAAEQTWVELYATYVAPPSLLWPKGRLQAKSAQARGSLLFTWTRTTVDPDLTEYVLVVYQGEKMLETLCQVKEARQNPHFTSQHIFMENTGHRTNQMVKGLKGNTTYHADVFAINVATNFSYKFAELERVKYSQPKPKPLSDNHQVAVELKPHEPTQIFRYKVQKEGMKKLTIEVTVCGEGSLKVRMRKRRGATLGEKIVTGYSVFTVENPELGATYLLKLSLPPGHRLVSAQIAAGGDEVEGSSLPEEAEVHEFRGLRGCREVTLGWLPVEGEATYCMRARQTKRDEPMKRDPDQCSVEQQLNSLGYSVLQCFKAHSLHRNVISERLTNLRPGKQYDIQISVRKGNSMRLSYKLIRIRTKSKCS